MPEETTAAAEETTAATEETTTPTLEELAAQVETLSQNLTAMQEQLQEVTGEAEYELRYSGEEADSLLDGGSTVFGSKTAGQIVSMMSRLFPLVMKWGSFTLNMTVNADNGSQWSYGTLENAVSEGLTAPYVYMQCDWNKTHFKSQSFSYRLSGRSIEWEAYLEHTSDQGGTYAFKVYYLILGKNSGGGSIG